MDTGLITNNRLKLPVNPMHYCSTTAYTKFRYPNHSIFEVKTLICHYNSPYRNPSSSFPSPEHDKNFGYVLEPLGLQPAEGTDDTCRHWWVPYKAFTEKFNRVFLFPSATQLLDSGLHTEKMTSPSLVQCLTSRND